MKADPAGDIHVTPIDDLRDHLDSRDCWCNPRIEIEESFLGGGTQKVIVIHHSLDGRELVEQHGIN